MVRRLLLASPNQSGVGRSTNMQERETDNTGNKGNTGNTGSAGGAGGAASAGNTGNRGAMGAGGDDRGRAAASERMRRAVAAAASGEGSKAELKAAALDLVNELRHRNESPEQVLLQIKQFLAEAGLRPHYPTPPDPKVRGSVSSLYRDVITWSIQAYYDGK
jgi:hypothetical protein